MERRILILGLAVCVIAPPVSATPDLFGISFSNFQSFFDGTDSFTATSFAATDSTDTVVHVYRNFFAPTGSATLSSKWDFGPEALLIKMQISEITGTTATGVGMFELTDVDGDTISGDINGTWERGGLGGTFDGDFSNVIFSSVANDTFDGHIGSVSMVFPAHEPWSGALHGPASLAWFVPGAPFETTGTLDSTISGTLHHGPVPGALVLAMLGAMGVAGLRRRGAV